MKKSFDKLDLIWLLPIGLGVIAIPFAFIIIHDNLVSLNQSEDFMIELNSRDYLECDDLQKRLDDWDEKILKPKRVVEHLEQRLMEMDCK